MLQITDQRLAGFAIIVNCIIGQNPLVEECMNWYLKLQTGLEMLGLTMLVLLLFDFYSLVVNFFSIFFVMQHISLNEIMFK